MDSKIPPNSGRQPPTLPPRQPSSTATSSCPTDAPPSYDSIHAPYVSWKAQNDPRTSSTESLTPSDDNNAEDLQHRPQSDRRRKLLCVFVHGFMGNETSFRSFPAHVHNLLAVLLTESHAVHTKIYPRYRSRQNISVARDDFSRWLEPHEGDNTDVVLLGHSMGGLICAEVALLLKHRVVGTVNFDVPFLGMHPGVVKSGLASIFTAAPEEPTDNWEDTQMAAEGEGPSSGDGFWRPEKKDPNFNPSFQNDKILPIRSGWRGAWHFISKHSNDLGKATKQLVTSHMEFGGAMANYPELKARYARLRALEEPDPEVRRSVVEHGTPPRIRFVNYYTASTGRPKKPKLEDLPDGVGDEASLEISENPMPKKEGNASSDTPLEDHSNGGHGKENEPEVSSDDEGTVSSPEMRHVEPSPEENTEDTSPVPAIDTPTQSPDSIKASSVASSLPPIPDEPTAPSPLEVSYIEDNQTRKLVEKKHARAVKAYEKAVKERERIIRDRAKLEEKRERKEKKEISKAEKDAHKARAKAEKEDGKQVKKMMKTAEDKLDTTTELTHDQREAKRLAEERERMEREERRMRGDSEPAPKQEQEHVNDTLPAQPSQPTIASSSSPPPEAVKPSKSSDDKKDKKPPKERKFCTLPPKDSQGERDPCWPRVFMKDVDEVGAHCGLFFVDERYERLVGDVAERIEEWVKAEGGIEAGLERMRMKS
ncbi:hypothetical protein Q7P37_004680 [Cladosporium fusiforme]